MMNSGTFDATNMTITTPEATVGCYDYWSNVYPNWSYNLNYCSHFTEDKGKTAYNLVKKLIESKLVEVRTAKQFMDLMDVVLKAI